MEIVYKNYIAKEENNRFNLSKKEMVTATRDTKNIKKGDRYEAEIFIGYGYTFERMLRRIAEDIMSKESKLEIKEYIVKFKEIVKEIDGVLAVKQ